MRRSAAVFVLMFGAMCVPAASPASGTTAASDVPPAVSAAKKVFLSNNGSDTADRFSGGPDRFFRDFYSDVAGMNRFDVVDDPANADVVLAMDVKTSQTVDVMKGNSNNLTHIRLRVRVVDAKTHFVLWTLQEEVPMAILQSNRDKNADAAVRQLVADLRAVAQTRPAQP